MTSKFAKDLPRLTRARRLAAREAEKARKACRNKTGGDYDNVGWDLGSSGSLPRHHTRNSWEGEDPEIYEEFLAWEQQRIKELEDRRAQERAALIQAKEAQKRKEQEDEHRAIEQQAVEKYKQELEQAQRNQLGRETLLKSQLASIGFEQDQIDLVLAIPALGPEIASASLPSTSVSPQSIALLGNIQSNDGSQLLNKRRPVRKRDSIRSLLGMSQTLTSDGSATRGIGSTFPVDQTQLKEDDTLRHNLDIELWLLDLLSKQHTELALPREWLDKYVKQGEKSDAVLRRLAQLEPMWRAAIQDFLSFRNGQESSETSWKLIDLVLPRRMAKLGLFGHKRGPHLIKVVLSRPNRRLRGANPNTRPGQNQNSVTTQQGANVDNTNRNSDGAGGNDSSTQPARADEDDQVKKVVFAASESSSGDAASKNDDQQENQTENQTSSLDKIPKLYMMRDGNARHQWITYFPKVLFFDSVFDALQLPYTFNFPAPAGFAHLMPLHYVKVYGKMEENLRRRLFKYAFDRGSGGVIAKKVTVIEPLQEFEEGFKQNASDSSESSDEHDARYFGDYEMHLNRSRNRRAKEISALSNDIDMFHSNFNSSGIGGDQRQLAMLATRLRSLYKGTGPDRSRTYTTGRKVDTRDAGAMPEGGLPQGPRSFGDATDRFYYADDHGLLPAFRKNTHDSRYSSDFRQNRRATAYGPYTSRPTRTRSRSRSPIPVVLPQSHRYSTPYYSTERPFSQPPDQGHYEPYESQDPGRTQHHYRHTRVRQSPYETQSHGDIFISTWDKERFRASTGGRLPDRNHYINIHTGDYRDRKYDYENDGIRISAIPESPRIEELVYEDEEPAWTRDRHDEYEPDHRHRPTSHKKHGGRHHRRSSSSSSSSSSSDRIIELNPYEMRQRHSKPKLGETKSAKGKSARRYHFLKERLSMRRPTSSSEDVDDVSGPEEEDSDIITKTLQRYTTFDITTQKVDEAHDASDGNDPKINTNNQSDPARKISNRRDSRSPPKAKGKGVAAKKSPGKKKNIETSQAKDVIPQSSDSSEEESPPLKRTLNRRRDEESDDEGPKPLNKGTNAKSESHSESSRHVNGKKPQKR